MQKIKVAHLTSAHQDNDIRIFHKECVSLVNEGYDVYQITLDSKERIDKGVSIISANFKASSRINRMLNATKKIYQKALELDADIYHFHDPELLRAGLKLRRKGKIVIYDAHEDTPRQILSKPYLNKITRKLISFIFEKFENYVAKRMSAIITATPFIRDRYLKINTLSQEVCNFPLYSEIENDQEDLLIQTKNTTNKICYIGGISEARGIKEMIIASAKSGVELNIAGTWPAGLQEQMKHLPGWSTVKNLGFLSREELSKIKKQSIAGLVILHPEPNHINSYPIKMFEYMAAGIPIISSDFPLWKSIVETENCGICVDPKNENKTSQAIDFLLKNPKEAKKMGENGRKAVIKKYNWNIEEKKLFLIYKSLLEGNT